MRFNFVFLLLINLNLFNFFNSYYINNSHPDMTLNNFTFGSCFYGRESTRLDIFEKIIKHNSQMFLWMGDAAYVDLQTYVYYWKSNLEVNFTLAEQIWSESKNEPHYKKFRETTPTIGTYDDHDYGINDGNGHFQHKERTKQLFLDFLDEPKESPRRTPDKGIYTSYTFGNPSLSHKTVRIILLDVRYNKTSPFWDENADILGEDQWAWLEEELSSNNETFTLIVSGTQILPINRFVMEAWYVNSRNRLFDLIGKLKKSGVVLLSGDIHAAEILKTFCVVPEIGYNLYEFTSSGLSHFDDDNFLMEYILPSDYNVVPILSYYNFGKFKFNWGESKEDSSITVSIIDIDNITRAEISLEYKDLVYDKNREGISSDCKERMGRKFKSLGQYIEYYKMNKRMLFFHSLPILMIIHFIYLIKKLVFFLIGIINKSKKDKQE